MDSEELSIILEESRKHNYGHGITGMLLYVEGIFVRAGKRSLESANTGRFMQILEGTKEEVEKIFDKIKKDRRHFNVTSLRNSPASCRYFESWQMGFKELVSEDLKDSAVYFDPDILFAAENDPDWGNPLNFIKSFYHRGQSQQTIFRR